MGQIITLQSTCVWGGEPVPAYLRGFVKQPISKSVSLTGKVDLMHHHKKVIKYEVEFMKNPLKDPFHTFF